MTKTGPRPPYRRLTPLRSTRPHQWQTSAWGSGCARDDGESSTGRPHACGCVDGLDAGPPPADRPAHWRACTWGPRPPETWRDTLEGASATKDRCSEFGQQDSLG